MPCVLINQTYICVQFIHLVYCYLNYYLKTHSRFSLCHYRNYNSKIPTGKKISCERKKQGKLEMKLE